MPNLPSFNPDQAGPKPTTAKGRRQQNVDLQSFLALAGPKQPLVETPAVPGFHPNSLGSVLTGQVPEMFTPNEPSYTFDTQTPTKPGTFDKPEALQSMLLEAGRQRTPYDPNAVRDSRTQWMEALSSTPGAKTTGQDLSNGVGPVLGDPKNGQQQEMVDTARAALDTALRAQRSRAIGNTLAEPLGGNIKKRTDEMTSAEYNALPPLQRAAIDYNTLLVDAVRKDRQHQDDYSPDPGERNKYNQTVEGMFGDDRGADGVYAPETVALLKKLGITDKAGDLNDYLSLNASIKAKDLDNLRPEQLSPNTSATAAENDTLNPANPLVADRQALEQMLAKSTKQMEMSLAKSTQLLSSITDTVKFEQNNMLAELGGLPNQPGGGLGWTPPQWGTDSNGQRVATDVNSKFVQGFETLAKKENAGQQDAILNAMQGWLSDSEYKAFLDYVDQRSMNSLRYKQPLVDAPDAMKAAHFREMLGLDSGGPAPAAPAAPAAGGGY